MISLLIAALLVVLGFSTSSAWGHASTDATSFTDWHWRPEVIIVVIFLSTAYVPLCPAWKRLIGIE